MKLIVVLFSLVSFTAYSQVVRSIDSKSPSSSVSVISGFGMFKDIQAPQGVLTDGRIDGTSSKLDNGSHVGPVLGMEATFKQTFSASNAEYNVKYLVNATSKGQKDSSISSLKRFSVSAASHRPFPRNLIRSKSWNYILQTQLSQDSFLTGSSGHVLRGVMPGAGVSYNKKEFTVSALVSALAYGDFSYELFGNKATFEKSSLNSWTGSIQSSLKLEKNSWLRLGLHHNSASVNLASVLEYNKAGAYLSDFDESSRQYDLSSSRLELGLISQF